MHTVLLIQSSLSILPLPSPHASSPLPSLLPSPSHTFFSRNVLVTNIMLDHDLTTTGTQDYSPTVTVNDTENAAFLIVHVQVIDINDNDPIFENRTYNFNICEKLPAGSTVGVVTAADWDSGTFGEVCYSLSGPSNESE